MRIQKLLTDILADFREILGDALTGLYLHGSLAFGCFTWETGDVDFLAVVSRPLTQSQRVALIQSMLRHTPDAPPKGLEMSVVLEDVCRNFVHPTPFELHFSNAHLSRCEADIDRYCREMHGDDPDLAAHFAVIRAVGQTLYGKPIDEVFAPVPREAVLDSIRGDVADADIHENPVYFTLNLCRVLAFQEEERMLSKAGGGEWALKRLPERFHPLICAALNRYASGGAPLPAEALDAFREEMLRRIFG